MHGRPVAALPSPAAAAGSRPGRRTRFGMELRSLTVGAVIPVSDLAASRGFYESTLGPRGEPAPGGWVLHAGEGTRLFLLEGTSYAGQAEWPLASIRTDDLAAMMIAWFRDPDGQVLSVFQLT